MFHWRGGAEITPARCLTGSENPSPIARDYDAILDGRPS